VRYVLAVPDAANCGSTAKGDRGLRCVAAKNLLAVQSSLGDLRGRWFEYRDASWR